MRSARRLALVGVGLAACLAACSDGAGVATTDDALGSDKVERVAKAGKLDIAEASGLAVRAIDGGKQLVVVGDDRFEIETLDVDGATLAHRRTIDLAKKMPRREAHSQWEAIAIDGRGRVAMLAEGPARITVFDETLDRVLREIELVPRGDVAVAWKKHENAKGEGLVLLANGHVLVASERDPAAIVEFGPEGDAPSGYAGRSREAAQRVEFPLHDELVSLEMWPLSKKALDHAPDVSELSLDEEGNLYLLSDEGRCFAKVRLPLSPDDEHTKLERVFRFDDDVEKPEGLAFVSASRVAVASDRPEADKKALYLFDLR